MPEYESATVPEGTMKLVTEASRHWLAVPGLQGCEGAPPVWGRQALSFSKICNSAGFPVNSPPLG